MKVKLKLLRNNQSSDDIVVQSDVTATVSQVAAAIAEADPRFDGASRQAAFTLQVFRPGFGEPQVLHPEKHVEEAELGSGLTVSLLETSSQRAVETMMGESRALLYVTSGPDRGKTFELETGTSLLGRSDDCLVQLDDPTISKQHARLELVGNTVLIVDLNSANGVTVDGGLVSRVQLQEGDRFSVGDTEIRIAELSSLKPVEFESNSGATVLFNRSPRVEGRHPGKEFKAPHPPGEEDPLPFPWLIMIAPLIMGGILFSITRSPLTIAFIALSPILMIGNYVSNRTNRKRRFQLGLERFNKQLVELDKNLGKSLSEERTARLAESPSTQEVLDDVVKKGSLLWTRRIEHWSFLNLRMGLGDLPSRNTVSEIAGEEKAMPEYLNQVTDIIEKHRLVTGVPVIENLANAGALGLAGPREISADVARSVLVQLTGLHSHVDLSLAAIVSSDWSEEFSWLRWLPHTASPQSPLGEFPHLADSASSVANLLTRLEELIENRVPRGSQQLSRRIALSFEDSVISQAAKVGQPESTMDHEDLPEPVLVLLVAGDPPVDRARLIQIAERGAAAGIFPIWVAPKVAELPAVCRTFFDLEQYSQDMSANFVRVGLSVESLLVERVGRDAVNAFASFIAPIVDISGMVEDSSDLPRSISLLSLLGPELAESSAAVVDRWNQNESILNRTAQPAPGQHKPGKLRALVGQAGADAMHLDLRAQGPHALVGGTTGSGKSEFLQAWVLGMAAEYSPDRVTFLFVDYKGGSAFADCVKLPHCVGLVTDLSQHLVRRALTSLRAELHYREHLFNRKKAKDILELEKRRDPETPPALILVIDEFAALVSDVPDFVDGVVDIAQRGRSLGIHLIMATQRPAGVIKDNLRANTNLRIALRMADESDSVDVVGEKVAASFDPSIPGRGIAKTGPGRLTPFQSGYAGGWTSNEPSPPSIELSELRFGTQLRWQPPASEKVVPDKDPGPTDQARLVSSIIGAAKEAELPNPRRPWLDELAEHYDLTKLRQRTDAKLAFAVTDIPAQQLQQTSYFLPDLDGHLAVYGTSGSGKTVLLRTLAAAAGITPRGGKVTVYGLDFGSGGLRMLDVLPHIGSIIDGSDQERVVRLFRKLKGELERRSRLFSDIGAGNIAEYRELANDPDAERILILLDNYPAFRNDFEVGSGKAEWYEIFQQILSEGRSLGIHIALSADRSSSVPGSVNANISKRIVLRLAEEAAYSMLDVPSDIINQSSTPGRAIIDDLESQIALFGTDRSVVGQAQAIAQLAETITAQGREPAEPIRSLAKQVSLLELPVTFDDRAVIGVSDVDLKPIGIELNGVFLIAGPPASGRSTALQTFTTAIQRAEPQLERYYFGSARSSLVAFGNWAEVALNLDAAAELAKVLEPRVVEYEQQNKRLVVVIEALGDYLSGSADAPLVALIKSIRRSSSFLLAEAETSAWASSWPLMAEIKSARRGFLLQPEGMDGDSILRTSIPRGNRNDFPEGRGFLVQSGKAVRVQLALPHSVEE